MKFYLVGFGVPGPYDRIHGDALVWAASSRDAITKVRKAGLVPNPGDVYILGSKVAMERSPEASVDVRARPELKEEAMNDPNGVAIIWSSWP